MLQEQKGRRDFSLLTGRIVREDFSNETAFGATHLVFAAAM